MPLLLYYSLYTTGTAIKITLSAAGAFNITRTSKKSSFYTTLIFKNQLKVENKNNKEKVKNKESNNFRLELIELIVN